MAFMLAPYNEAMRLGMGFNSFTQQLCVNDVVRKPGGRKVSDSDLRAITPRPRGQDVVSHSAGDAGILSQPTGTSYIQHKDGQTAVSQVVSWEAGFVDKVSEITDSLHISGQLTITVDALGGGAGGGGNYLSSTALSKSDATYKVTVKVTNQKLIADDMTEFSPIPNVPASMFNEVYGDTFISGFIQGGVFNGLVMKELADTTKKKEMGANLSLKLALAGVGKVEGEAKADKVDDTHTGQHSTTINVSWSGGGDIKTDGWDIPDLMKVALEFPDRVAACPQTTYAILTKYTSLRSYREQAVKGSPLDYETAGIYSAALLDAYMDYKTMWKDIQQMSTDMEHNLARIETRTSNSNLASYGKNFKIDYDKRFEKFEAKKALMTTAREQSLVTLEEPLTPNLLEPYAADIFGLDKAKADCRFEMIKIVREANDLALNPKVSTDPSRLWRYLSPNIFRTLLPKSKQAGMPKSPEEIEELKTQLEAAIRKEASSNVEALKAENKQMNQLSKESRNREAVNNEEMQKLKAENARMKQQLSDESRQRDVNSNEELQKLIADNKYRKQQVSDTQTRAEKAESTLEIERAQKAEVDRKVVELENGALKWERNEKWRRGRVQIYHILYGGQSVLDDNVAQRMISYAERHETFTFTTNLFGCDPMPGRPKCGAVLYRFDDASIMRCLVGKENQSVRFNGIPGVN